MCCVSDRLESIIPFAKEIARQLCTTELHKVYAIIRLLLHYLYIPGDLTTSARIIAL